MYVGCVVRILGVQLALIRSLKIFPFAFLTDDPELVVVPSWCGEVCVETSIPIATASLPVEAVPVVPSDAAATNTEATVDVLDRQLDHIANAVENTVQSMSSFFRSFVASTTVAMTSRRPQTHGPDTNSSSFVFHTMYDLFTGKGLDAALLPDTSTSPTASSTTAVGDSAWMSELSVAPPVVPLFDTPLLVRRSLLPSPAFHLCAGSHSLGAPLSSRTSGTRDRYSRSNIPIVESIE